MKSLIIYIGIAVLLVSPLSAKAFAVAPGLVELNADRGQVIETTLQLINTSDAPQTVYLSKQKFEANETSGAPKFIPYDDDHFGLVDWLQLPFDRITVEARTKVDVPLTIAIPSDIASGGYYGSVIFSPAPHEIVATNGATINAKTAVLLLLTVSGENNEKLALLDFTSGQSNTWQTLPSGEFAFRLQNQGNIHVLPEGTISVKDILGRLISVANANPASGRVLPGSTRTYQGDFGPQNNRGFVETLKSQWQNFALGPVTVSLDLSYGDQPQALHSDFSMWVFPWQLLVSVIAVLIILGLVIRGLKRKTSKP